MLHTHSFRPAELEKPIQTLKETMEKQCSEYFEKPETKKPIVEVPYTVCIMCTCRNTSDAKTSQATQ